MGSDASPFFTYLESFGVSTFVRESTWAYPTLESLHVMAIALVVGSIWIVDLRILGLMSGRRPLNVVMAEMLPITWTVFGLAVLTGVLMFASSAAIFSQNGAFLIKMALLAGAAVNMAYFHKFAMGRWAVVEPNGSSSTAMKLGGATSILIWTAVIVAGRWIGFL